MRSFRTFISAFLVLLGVMMIVSWAFASKTVDAVESGDAAANLTNAVLSSPEIADKAATTVTDKVHDEIAAKVDSDAFELLWTFAEQPIHDAVVSALGSDAVTNVAESGASKLQAGLVEALTDKDRVIGPLLLGVDVSPRVNARIDEIPFVGTLIPDVTVPPLELTVMEAEVFQDVHTVYSSAKFMSTWFIWIGLLLVALGVMTSPRRKWFLARSMLLAGVLVLAIGFTVNAFGAHTIAGLVPGGTEGGLGTTVDQLLSDTAIPTITGLLVKLGIAALVLAILSLLAVRYVPVFRDRVRAERELNAEPLVHSEGAGSGSTETDVAGSDVKLGDTLPLPVSVGAGAVERDAGESSTASIPTSVSTAVTVESPTVAAPEAPAVVPSAKKPAARKPAAKRPASSTASAAGAKQPVAKKPAAKKPAAAKATPAARKPAAKKPVAKKPAVTKPAATKPAATKPAAAKPVSGEEPPTTA
ncbi:hypothetical protein [Demequina aurantiaca]|uniref:hypothetical protein n=1 Tax=Demequina aurantiaca TaxID=676200 RepID=UPI003D3436E0